MHFIPEVIEEYVINHSEREPELLQELNRETNEKVLQPRMLSGHYQGRILSLFSKLMQPVAVLEIGTYTGYSALCLAEGLAAGGKVHTIDINEELADLQKRYFDKSSYKNQIIPYLGDASEIIPQLDFDFDLVFIDADKENYLLYFELIIDKLRSGGILISDNVLWSGKVTEVLKKEDQATKTLLEYNKILAEDIRLETVMLPVRDGLTISRKK